MKPIRFLFCKHIKHNDYWHYFLTSVPVYNIWRAFYSLSCSINSVIVYSAKYSYNNVVTIGDSWALNIVKNYNTILRVFTTVSQKTKNLYSSKLYYVLVCYCHCVSADVDGDQFNFVPFCDKQGETEQQNVNDHISNNFMHHTRLSCGVIFEFSPSLASISSFY